MATQPTPQQALDYLRIIKPVMTRQLQLEGINVDTLTNFIQDTELQLENQTRGKADSEQNVVNFTASLAQIDNDIEYYQSLIDNENGSN